MTVLEYNTFYLLIIEYLSFQDIQMKWKTLNMFCQKHYNIKYNFKELLPKALEIDALVRN